MEPAQTERRLAAIMIADAVGYSRLMSRDEEGTLARLAAARVRIDELVAQHRGRIFASSGDNIVAEFSSPVEAVRCAAEIQRAMRTLDGDRPKDSRLEFRIGINLGDVIVSGGNLFGDGVNVAARIEAVAQPGGILVTGPVHDQVRGKVEFEFDDLGERRLKNIAQPVALFRARLEGGAGRPVARWRALAIGVAAAAAAAGAIWLWSYNGVGLGNRGERQVILVAPFRPIGADLAERELSDGLHQDVTVALARRGNVEVAALPADGDERPDLGAAAKRAGAQFVLEGSVRVASGRLRVTSQLMDTATGHAVWAASFDRGLDDVLAAQAEISREIVDELPEELEDHAPRRGIIASATTAMERLGRMVGAAVDHAMTAPRRLLGLDQGGAGSSPPEPPP